MKYILFFTLLLVMFSSYAQDSLRTPISHNGKWGYIDDSGDTIIKPIYTWVGEFHEGIVRVYLGGRIHDDMGPPHVGGKYGFLDSAGNRVTKCKYNHASDFQNGLAFVHTSTRKFILENYINKRGREIVPKNHRIAYQKPFGSYPHPSMAVLIGSNEISYFKKVNPQMAKKFLEKHPECKGVLRKYSGNAVGVLDSSGAVIVESKFNGIGFSHEEKLIYVTKQDGIHKLRGLYDFSGKVLLEPRYLKISEFKNGVATVVDKNQLVGLIDAKGSFLIDCKFKEIVIENERVKAFSRDSCDRVTPYTDSLIVLNDGLNRFKGFSLYSSHYISRAGNCPGKPEFITFRQLGIKEE